MKLNFDSERIEFPCQACSKNLRETIGRLKKNPDLTCTCGAVNHVDASDLRQGIAKADKALVDFERNLKKMFK